jgi:hypothetical protein
MKFNKEEIIIMNEQPKIMRTNRIILSMDDIKSFLSGIY